ncbi:hypothetical protein HAX54_036011, partial [Datura stramonium]|nr:hypothetical protein [Datura stramonium]
NIENGVRESFPCHCIERRSTQALEAHRIVRHVGLGAARSTAWAIPMWKNKEKGVASSSHGSKRSRRANEEKNKDVSLPQQPFVIFGSVGSQSKK